MDLEVDLVNYRSDVLNDDGYGVVRLCMNGQRSPICDNDWDENEARVACSSAGFSPYGIQCKHQVQLLHMMHIC